MFNVDIEPCARCGGPMKIVAFIEDPAVIKAILAHLDKTASRTAVLPVLPPAAATPPPSNPSLERRRNPAVRGRHENSSKA